MDRLEYPLEEREWPTCPNCGNAMQLYRSELIKFEPATDLRLFICPTCLLFAESESAHEPVWVPPGAAPHFRFFGPSA